MMRGIVLGLMLALALQEALAQELRFSLTMTISTAKYYQLVITGYSDVEMRVYDDAGKILYEEARKQCQALKGDLAVISSLEEEKRIQAAFKLVRGYAKLTSFWIGLTKDGSNRSWISGEKIFLDSDLVFESSSQWKSKDTAGCGVIFEKGIAFNDCYSGLRGYVCQLPVKPASCIDLGPDPCDVSARPRSNITFERGNAAVSSYFYELRGADNGFAPLESKTWWASAETELPAFIWYDFVHQTFSPTKVAFYPANYAHGSTQMPKEFQFIGSNDDVCNTGSTWTVLCKNQYPENTVKKDETRGCEVDFHSGLPFSDFKFRCLGIKVLRVNGGNPKPIVALTGIQMWKLELC